MHVYNKLLKLPTMSKQQIIYAKIPLPLSLVGLFTYILWFLLLTEFWLTINVKKWNKYSIKSIQTKYNDLGDDLK